MTTQKKTYVLREPVAGLLGEVNTDHAAIVCLSVTYRSDVVTAILGRKDVEALIDQLTEWTRRRNEPEQPQDQTPHSPCITCHITKEITPAIQHYTTLYQNLTLFHATKLSPLERAHVTQKLNLVSGFLNELHLYHRLIQAPIEANRLQVVE